MDVVGGCNAINPRDFVVEGGVFDPHRPLPRLSVTATYGFLASGRLRLCPLPLPPRPVNGECVSGGVRDAIVKSGVVVR